MRRRYFCRVGAALVGLVAVATFVAFLVSQNNRPHQEYRMFENDYNAIETGMTEKEVHAILGRYLCKRETHEPLARHPWAGSSRPHPWGERKLYGEAVVTVSYKFPDRRAPELEGLYIFVYFDAYGQVVGKDMVAVDS
jgi:hypothetical protein